MLTRNRPKAAPEPTFSEAKLAELNKKMFRDILIFGGIVILVISSLFFVLPTSLFAAEIPQATSTEQVQKDLNDLKAKLQRKSVVLTIPEVFDESSVEAFNQLETGLREIQNVDVTLEVTGLGGDGLMMNDFIRAIEDAQANGNTIRMDIIGPAASAHAFITCYANSVTMRPGSSLLFHQGYGFISLFMGMLEYRQMATQSIITNMTDGMMQECVKRGRLTAKDTEVIKSGDDVIYIAADGKITKQYERDSASVIDYTIPMFLVKFSSIVFLLGVLASVVYIIRRSGVRK